MFSVVLQHFNIFVPVFYFEVYIDPNEIMQPFYELDESNSFNE